LDFGREGQDERVALLWEWARSREMRVEAGISLDVRVNLGRVVDGDGR